MEPSTPTQEARAQEAQILPPQKKSFWSRINDLSLAVRAHADLVERDQRRAKAKAEARREAGDI